MPRLHQRQSIRLKENDYAQAGLSFITLVANGCLAIYQSKGESMGKFWQRNYYEHIIRNEVSYQRISEYILNNPINWADDDLYREV